MRVLLDTNVILDVWLAREPFVHDSARVLGLVERKRIEGVVCPTTITTLHYLARKELGEKRARSLIGELVKITRVGIISSGTFSTALESKINDFEDAVIESVAISEKVDFIVSRNTADFKKSKIPAKEPIEIV
jgi:predicted nucleic acid-binding protein